MLYQRKSFTVPAAGPNVTQEEWDRIFGKREKKEEKETEPVVVEYHTDKVPATLPDHSGSVLAVKERVDGRV